MERARPWVKLHTSALSSDRVLDLSPVAAKLWFMSLMRAALECRDGRVVADVRKVARWSGLDVSEVPAAIVELVEAGLWAVDGVDAVLSRWDETQVSEGQVEAARAKSAERKRRFEERRKAGDPKQSEKPAPSAQSAGLPSATEMGALVRTAAAACDGSIGSYLETLTLAQDVAAAAEAAGQATPRLSAHLMHQVVAAAAAHHFEDRIPGEKLPLLFKLAQQVGVEHVLWAIIDSASRDISGDAHKYVAQVARRHAQEVAV